MFMNDLVVTIPACPNYETMLGELLPGPCADLSSPGGL